MHEHCQEVDQSGCRAVVVSEKLPVVRCMREFLILPRCPVNEPAITGSIRIDGNYVRAVVGRQHPSQIRLWKIFYQNIGLSQRGIKLVSICKLCPSVSRSFYNV